MSLSGGSFTQLNKQMGREAGMYTQIDMNIRHIHFVLGYSNSKKLEKWECVNSGLDYWTGWTTGLTFDLLL